MGTVIVGVINGNTHWVDSDAPTVAVGPERAIGNGGKVVFSNSKWIYDNSALSGITDVGSGAVITAAERTNLHTHANTTALDQLAVPTGGQIGYLLTVTSSGTYDWVVGTPADPNHQGAYADLAALQAAIPTGQAGWFAILINSGTDASFGVWDPDAGPAAWIDTTAVTGITSVNGDVGPVVVLDSDEVSEGATNLYLTAAERTDIALVDGHTTDIAARLLTSTWSASIASSLVDLGSGSIITAAERSTVAASKVVTDDLASPATPADDDKVWKATSGTGGWAAETAGITTVNGDSGPTVVLDADDIAATGTRLWFSATNSSDLAAVQVSAAGNATAIARFTNQIVVTFATSLAPDATSGLVGTTTLSGNTAISLVANLATGETFRHTLTQDDTGGRHADLSAFEHDDVKLSKEAGAATTLDIYEQAGGTQRIGVTSRSQHETKRLILYPASTYQSIGGGATNIWDNVDSAAWTWDDVRQYDYCTYADLQYSGWQYSDTLKRKVKAVQANAPKLKILAQIRQDLWWFYHEGGVSDATRQWGNAACISGAKPTFAMGQTPRDSSTWADGQAIIESGTYTQNADHATLTTNGTLLSLPYQIHLDAAGNEWSCRNAIMRLNDEDWLDLLTDNLAYQFGFGEVDGFYIIVEKLQHYRTPTETVTYQLHEWLDDVVDPAVALAGGTSNPGWVLNTDSGGSSGTGQKPSWSVGSSTVQDAYDDYGTQTILDAFEGCLTLIQMLRDKIPRAHLVYSPFNLSTDSWRNSVYRGVVRTAAIANYAHITDDAEADAYFAELIARSASLCDACEIELDHDATNDTNAFASPFLSTLRSRPHVGRVSKPQNISLLADQ